MSDSISIRALGDDERGWAAARYQAIRFSSSPPRTVALIAELAGVRVGLGRLVTHAPGVVELGGIWTDEASRGLGIARAMVAALLARHDALSATGASPAGPLWCIPFVHLIPFYRSCGFAARAEPWPAAIAAKVADCVAHALPEVAVLAR